nr:peptidoglycan-binding domain-containing protein [uncultured Ruegeria sp.]
MARSIFKHTLGGALAASMMMTASVERANAGAKEVIGTAMLLCLANPNICPRNKPRPPGRKPVPTPVLSEEERQQNRDVQNALNTFGFPVGNADGVLGRRSRAAIRDYQYFMGDPANGRLSQWERDTLINAWRKYQAGAGNAYPRLMAAEGPRGLLKVERNPGYAGHYGDGQQPQPYPSPQPEDGHIVAPNKSSPPPIVGELPKRIGTPVKSVAGRCELVGATSKIQGGLIHADNVTDHHQALSEKLCEARGLVITLGQSSQSHFAVSETEMTEICNHIKATFSGTISALPGTPVQSTLDSARNANATLGLNMPQIARDYGEICTGMGYRMDDAEMALAGALSLTASGHAAYGELVGHHLREGFGTAEAPKASVEWYANAMTALENGAPAVFMASATQDRISVIRKAMQIAETQAALHGVPVNARWSGGY